MIRAGQKVFVDTGGWLALALSRDVYHQRAVDGWTALQRSGARFCTSVPVIIETFTYMDRKVDPGLARTWSAGVRGQKDIQVIECNSADLLQAWPWLERRDLHKLSLVDAISFVLLRKHRIRHVLAFDTHFAQAGFRSVA